MNWHKMKEKFVTVLMLSVFGMTAASSSVWAIQEMNDSDLSENVAQGLIVADKLDGITGSNHTFYRMMLNAKLGLNNNIDKLQLGCGGFNEAVVANACDIDIDYVTMMGRVSSGGQAGADGSGNPADSQFIMIRPYIELAIKNDNDPTKRQLVGFKLGAAQVDGYMGTGRYIRPGTAGTSCTAATDGAGAYYCNMGINRLSGFMDTSMQGEAFGCFGLFGCTPSNNRNQQYRVATFNQDSLKLWGTRMNRAQVEMTAHTDPAATMGLSLSAPTRVNTSLRAIHGMIVRSDDPKYLADDFFFSFQREAVRYPTYNKISAYSNAANPGWWMNIPGADLKGLKAYGIVAGLGSLGGMDMTDPDVGQRPPSNCFGGLKFC